MSSWITRALAALVAVGVLGLPAQAQQIGNGSAASALSGTVQDCTEIASVPFTIRTPGQYCLKRDLQTGISSGNAIEIQANHVAINLNGFKLGGLAAGASTQATGIYALGRRNITIRNGTVRGFRTNVALYNVNEQPTSGHIVENIRSENARAVGIAVDGGRVLVRNNFIVNTVNPDVSALTALLMLNSAGSVVAENVITGVGGDTAGDAIGISVSSSGPVIVEGNRIYDVNGSNAQGIYTEGVGRAVLKGNVLVNTVPGLYGLMPSSDDPICVDNVVTGFSRTMSTCRSSRNNINF